MVSRLCRIKQAFFIKNLRRQNISMLYIRIILPKERDNLTDQNKDKMFTYQKGYTQNFKRSSILNSINKETTHFEIQLRDVERCTSKYIKIYDSKQTLLILNMLQLDLEKKQEKEERKDYVDYKKQPIQFRYVNYSKQIIKLRETILQRMIMEKKQIQGQSIELRTAVMKNEQIGLRIKDDESILRHLIVRSPRLLNYFNIIHRSYVLKSKELGGRCSVTANFYTIKSSTYNPNQSMLLYLNIFPYNLRIKQFNIFLGFQDLQAVDKDTCMYIFEKHNFITENVMQCLAQKIVSQVFVFRTFLGMQLYFKQIRAPKPVRRKTLLLNSPYKKLAASSKKFLLQTTTSIENAAESQKSGDSIGISKNQSRNEIDDSLIMSNQKGVNQHLNLNVPLSTIHSPHSGNYNHSQFQLYHHQMSQQQSSHNQNYNRMKDKHMKGIKKFASSNAEKDLYQKKKAVETLTKIKYVRNKYTKYSFDQSIDKEISKPFLEEIVHQKRIIYQSAKVFKNQYAIVTVMRDLVFDSFYLQIYIPKMSRTIQSNITLTKLVDCSWNFFSQVFKDKFFFFFDNNSYLQLFENYQRFALRCIYMEREKSTLKNTHKKPSTYASMFTLAEPINKQYVRLNITDENLVIQSSKVYSLRNMKDISMQDSDEYIMYVNPNASQLRIASNEPSFTNFMKDIVPNSSLYIPNPSITLGVNLFKKKGRIIKFLQQTMKKKEKTTEQTDANKTQLSKLLSASTTTNKDEDNKKKAKKSIYSKDKDSNPSDIQIKQQLEESQNYSDSEKQQNASFYQKKNISINEYLSIPFLKDLESSDLETINSIAASPRQLSYQLKKSQEFIKAQIDEKRKSISAQNSVNYNDFNSAQSASTSQELQKSFIPDSKNTIQQKPIQPPKREIKGLWRNLVLKHRLKLVYCKNQKRIFEFFRKESSRKIDRIYQFAALTEHIDTYYTNQIQSNRLKQLYNYIEIYIWDKIIQQFTTIQACPDKDNMKQEEVEAYVEKEEINNKIQNSNNNININNSSDKNELNNNQSGKNTISSINNININNFNSSQDNSNSSKIINNNNNNINNADINISQASGFNNNNNDNNNNNNNNNNLNNNNNINNDIHQTFSVYLCIDNTSKLYLRELLHTDYMKIDRNEEYQTSVFVDFIKKTQEDNNGHESPKNLIDEYQPLVPTKKQKAEQYYFETLPTIGYTESSNHIVYIKHQNLNDQTVQKMRINLREIVNLFIAEGYFKSQTNYANSKLSYAEMKQLCHFIIYKIKTNEFFDIVEIKTTIRNFYYHTQTLDPVQKIIIKSVLDVNRKSIKFVISKIGTFENASRVESTQFFEAYVPFFQPLIKSKQYDLALQRVTRFYGPKMLVLLYMK